MDDPWLHIPELERRTGRRVRPDLLPTRQGRRAAQGPEQPALGPDGRSGRGGQGSGSSRGRSVGRVLGLIGLVFGVLPAMVVCVLLCIVLLRLVFAPQ